MNNIMEMVTESWFWRYFFSHFGWVDWTLCAFLLVGILLGLKHGVSQELPRLLGMLISLYVTFEFYMILAAWLARETPWPESYTRVFTFGIIWASSWFSLRLIFEIVGRLMHIEAAKPIQMVGGVLLGMVRYFLFFSFISYFLVLFPLDWIHRSYQVSSWSGQLLVQVVPKIHDWIKGTAIRKATA